MASYSPDADYNPLAVVINPSDGDGGEGLYYLSIGPTDDSTIVNNATASKEVCIYMYIVYCVAAAEQA